MNLREWWRGEDWIGRLFGSVAGILSLVIVGGATVFYLWLILGVFL